MIECPGAEGQLYQSPTTNKVFRRECNMNYMYYDLANFTVINMQQCMDACARNEGCKLVNWQYWGPPGTDQNYCWLKTQIGSDVRAGGGMESAILVD